MHYLFLKLIWIAFKGELCSVQKCLWDRLNKTEYWYITPSDFSHNIVRQLFDWTLQMNIYICCCKQIYPPLPPPSGFTSTWFKAINNVLYTMRGGKASVVFGVKYSPSRVSKCYNKTIINTLTAVCHLMWIFMKFSLPLHLSVLL